MIMKERMRRKMKWKSNVMMKRENRMKIAALTMDRNIPVPNQNVRKTCDSSCDPIRESKSGFVELAVLS